MRKIAFLVAFTTLLFADGQMLTSRDFSEFYLSTHLKEEITKELRNELNISIEGAKIYLSEAIKEESEKHRKLYYTQVEEFARDLAALKEEVSFLRELVVDANYQRNSNDDVLLRIRESFEELEKRFEKLEKESKPQEDKPEIPDAGQKL